MKTSLFNSLLVASLLVFAVGCGKESKKSSGVAYPSLYNQGLTANNQQTVANVTNWFNGAQEGTRLMGPVTIKKIQLAANSGQNCTQKTFLGIPYQYCTYSSTSNQGTELSSVTASLFQDGIAINAKGNTELNNVFNGSQGTLINATESGMVAQLDFLQADGTIISYIIDRSYHSRLNPVKKSVISQGVKTEVITTATPIII
jgi:hypothetical protein